MAATCFGSSSCCRRRVSASPWDGAATPYLSTLWQPPLHPFDHGTPLPKRQPAGVSELHRNSDLVRRSPGGWRLVSGRIDQRRMGDNHTSKLASLSSPSASHPDNPAPRDQYPTATASDTLDPHHDLPRCALCWHQQISRLRPYRQIPNGPT